MNGQGSAQAALTDPPDVVIRKPNGYYTVLVVGALARLRCGGNAHPTGADVFRLLSKLTLLSETDQNARAACFIACKSAAVRAADRALADAAGGVSGNQPRQRGGRAPGQREPDGGRHTESQGEQNHPPCDLTLA